MKVVLTIRKGICAVVGGIEMMFSCHIFGQEKVKSTHQPVPRGFVASTIRILNSWELREMCQYDGYFILTNTTQIGDEYHPSRMQTYVPDGVTLM